uniref:FYVE and coiled-coil domain-containing protein 1 n=1 Tax=Periophthalmus magnuspinnatus TaxID=409849 RepID=A0A3B4AR01_9GOBI
MASGATAVESQLQRIIRDLHDSVAELAKECSESGEPVTDDSTNLHKFSYKLEYLLQFGQKEKTTLLGTKKDYWDYFVDCLAKIKGANDGIRFVKSITELKTSVGKGRAFIRYSLVHQRLADTLQQCLMNQRVTRASIASQLSADIISHLYELNDVQFDVASRGHDLDAAWPTFARRALNANSPSHTWKPPSRSSSINSLASNYSQVFFCNSLFFLYEDASTIDELRLELDQSELKMRELLNKVQQMAEQEVELRGVVEDLQRQLDISLTAQENQQVELKNVRGREDTLSREIEAIRNVEKVREAEHYQLQEKMAAAESKNIELLAKLDGVLNEKGHQAASFFDSAQKIHELLDKLKEAEKGKMDAVAEMEEKKRLNERLEEELKLKTIIVKDCETKLEDVVMSKAKLDVQLKEQKCKFEKENCDIKEQLESKGEELVTSVNTLQELQTKNQEHAAKNEEYKVECGNLMEFNEKLQATVRKNEEQVKEMMRHQAELEAQLAGLRASEKQLRGQLDDTKMTVDEKEKRLREENRELDEHLQRANMAAKMSESTVKRLEQDNQALKEEQKSVNAALKATIVKQMEMMECVTSEKQAIEKSQFEKSTAQAKQNQEVTSKLNLVEEQLDVSMKEVSRLQAEILDLRVQVQRSEEEKLKSQAQLEMTEAQRNELRTLTEKLKATIEALNQKHVEELMECKKKEEALIKERDKELGNSAELASTLADVHEEVSMLKEENERLVLENSDTREGLHRVNTEMAEMGMTICKLSAEKEEAREQWAADEVRIEEFEKEVERFGECMDELREENKMLKEELAQMEKLPKRIKELQDQLEKANSQVQSLKNSTREEVEAVKFQMSSESMNHQVQIKVRHMLHLWLKVVVIMLQYSCCLLITEFNRTTQQGENAATGRAEDTKDAHLAAQALCDELKHKLETTEVDKQTQILKMSAEIDDLNRTKTILEERLIELIRDKDALWQKTDALEFEQKLRSEERWWLMDKEATHCLGCQGQFTWWLRKHHCRLCGRIFCYYCSNNFVMTKQSGKKERCCKDCYNQHSSVVERFSEAELSPSETQAPSPGPGPQPCPDSDDGIFDIITEDEVHRVYDSDAASQTTAGSLDGEQAPRLLNISTGDVTPEEAEEHIPTVQDSEINLLKSGEVTMAIPFSIEDISQFGGGSRELFIKSSNYSVITVTVCDCGATISWMFSSEPKSISFSVVHRESTDTPIEQSKVLIPLTRCNSHKETVQGQLKVRHPGLYTLIFDNSFSRFISKKVFYHLTMEQPIVYDGSDIP